MIGIKEAEKRFERRRKQFKIAFWAIMAFWVLMACGFFWLSLEIVQAIQAEGLKGIVETIWNGSK